VDRVLFRTIVMEARNKKDAELSHEVATQVLTAENVVSRAKAVACGCNLSVLGTFVINTIIIILQTLRVVGVNALMHHFRCVGSH